KRHTRAALLGLHGNVVESACRKEAIDRLRNFARMQCVAGLYRLRRGKVGRVQKLRGRIFDRDDFLPLELCNLPERTDWDGQSEYHHRPTRRSPHVATKGCIRVSNVRSATYASLFFWIFFESSPFARSSSPLRSSVSPLPPRLRK